MAQPVIFRQQQRRVDPRLIQALGMIRAGADTSPVRHPLQGLARIAQAISGKIQYDRIEGQDRARRQAVTNTINDAMRASQPWRPPEDVYRQEDIMPGPTQGVQMRPGAQPVVKAGQPAPNTGGLQAIAAALMKNQDTAPYGLRLRANELGQHQRLVDALQKAQGQEKIYMAGRGSPDFRGKVAAAEAEAKSRFKGLSVPQQTHNAKVMEARRLLDQVARQRYADTALYPNPYSQMVKDAWATNTFGMLEERDQALANLIKEARKRLYGEDPGYGLWQRRFNALPAEQAALVAPPAADVPTPTAAPSTTVDGPRGGAAAAPPMPPQPAIDPGYEAPLASPGGTQRMSAAERIAATLSRVGPRIADLPPVENMDQAMIAKVLGDPQYVRKLERDPELLARIRARLEALKSSSSGPAR